MSVADEIRAKVDEAFKSPEFIGYLMSRYETTQLRARMSNIAGWEGAFGDHMRNYVRLKLVVHRKKRMARELDAFNIRPDLHKQIMTEIDHITSKATQHRARAVDEALGNILD